MATKRHLVQFRAEEKKKKKKDEEEETYELPKLFQNKKLIHSQLLESLIENT